MRVSFRQGIARYQTDVYSTPTFVRKSSNGQYVDLIVSPDPTIIIFAHKNATYVVEESKTVSNAWGPFPTGGGTKHLYWDLSLLDASLTRGFTSYPPIVNATAPANPAMDQHWFDLSTNQMKVWNGQKWLDKLRVFAATLSSSAVLNPAPLGSQVGLTGGSFEAGSLVLDSFKKPIRQADGSFLTTTTELTVINAGSQPVKFETEILSAMADEYIPKFSLVQLTPTRRLRLNRSDNWKSRIVGIVTEDLHQSEVGNVITWGMIKNEQWSWAKERIGRPVFSDETGQVTMTPPAVGVSQVVGYINDVNSILLDIQGATILDDIRYEPLVAPSPPPIPPIASFELTPTTGVAPLRVTAVNTSQHNPTSIEWDFGNNGTVDATTPEASFVFSAPGVYSVRLKVINPHGHDELVKQNAVVVTAPSEANLKTNLGVQVNGPLQVPIGQQFSITVVTANDGAKTATNVLRVVTISDVAPNAAPILDAFPTGATTLRGLRSTVLTLPVIPTLPSGQHKNATITLTAPSVTGTFSVRVGVVSPEVDAQLGDNAAELTIRVK